MTKPKTLDQLRAEKERAETQLLQEQHKLNRLENRKKYLEKGERQKRTHRLCNLGGTIESLAPEFKDLTRTEMTELMEYIFSLAEVQRAVRHMAIIHILDWALHLDEGTPHIHERHVFDCENRYGELCPQQEKALEELGIPLPNPEKPKGRNNNRKQTFDAVCRTILFDIARRHGLHLDQEPSYGGRDYLEKQDYILMKQKEQLAAQEQKLEELTLKIEDVETLLDDVSDAAYDKAVEVVTDTVRQETHKEDIRLVEESKKWVLSPERKAPKKEREYAAERLDGVITKIKNAMQHALAKIQRTLMQPEVKQAGKEQVKKKAKESIMDILAKAKINADRDNRERWEREGRIAPTKKNDIEL